MFVGLKKEKKGEKREKVEEKTDLLTSVDDNLDALERRTGILLTIEMPELRFGETV